MKAPADHIELRKYEFFWNAIDSERRLNRAGRTSERIHRACRDVISVGEVGFCQSASKGRRQRSGDRLCQVAIMACCHFPGKAALCVCVCVGDVTHMLIQQALLQSHRVLAHSEWGGSDYNRSAANAA